MRTNAFRCNRLECKAAGSSAPCVKRIFDVRSQKNYIGAGIYRKQRAAKVKPVCFSKFNIQKSQRNSICHREFNRFRGASKARDYCVGHHLFQNWHGSGEENFSVVNGGQTTYQLYKSESIYKGKDFWLPYKIIKSIGETKDEKTDFNGYSPSNFGDVYRGNISVRESIAYSSNVCAVQATSILGLNDAVSFLRTVGFDILPSEENLTLSLGATEQTMATLASAYGVFSSGLVRHATFIKEIKDENGNVLYSNDESGKTALHSDSIAYINDCLKACSEYGTAKKLKDLLYAKTGSVGGSNGNSDVWCVGYDDERVYCAWAGNLSMEKDKMLSQTGGGLTAEIVKNAYTDVGQPARIYAKKGYIDSLSLSRDGVIRLADENTPERYKIYDYVGNIKEVTSYFSSPEARFESAIEGNVLTLNCEPYKENIYQIAVVSTGGFFAKAYSYEELQEPLVFNLPNGFTIVTVTAYSKGVRLSKGEEVIKRYWV